MIDALVDKTGFTSIIRAVMRNHVIVFRFIQAVALALALIASGPAKSQDGKLPVSVDHSGSDVVGQRLAFALREAIRSSAGYKLAQGREALLYISLITIDPERNPQNAGLWTAAAVAYNMRNDLPFENGNPQTWYPINLSTAIVIAGTNRIDEQAKGILAGLDKHVEEYRRDMQQRK